MSNTSNFRQAFQNAQTQSLVGSNVIANALPWLAFFCHSGWGG